MFESSAEAAIFHKPDSIDLSMQENVARVSSYKILAGMAMAGLCVCCC